eukprot:g19900.t1
MAGAFVQQDANGEDGTAAAAKKAQPAGGTGANIPATMTGAHPSDQTHLTTRDGDLNIAGRPARGQARAQSAHSRTRLSRAAVDQTFLDLEGRRRAVPAAGNLEAHSIIEEARQELTRSEKEHNNATPGDASSTDTGAALQQDVAEISNSIGMRSDDPRQRSASEVRRARRMRTIHALEDCAGVECDTALLSGAFDQLAGEISSRDRAARFDAQRVLNHPSPMEGLGSELAYKIA